jgi:hypothetical protein
MTREQFDKALHEVALLEDRRVEHEAAGYEGMARACAVELMHLEEHIELFFGWQAWENVRSAAASLRLQG